MDILVTGGTVFASRSAAEFFVSEGHNVYVLNRGSKPQSDGVHHICADRHSPGDSLRKYSFDAVIDVTAYNAEDVRGLLGGLGDFGTYILISSSAVYPEALPQPFSEKQPVGPNSIWGAYGTNKIAAENALIEKVTDAYILRPPYLYGKMNNLHREAFVFECAEKGLPFYMPGDGTMTLQFFDIGDMCRLMKTILAEKPGQHILNVGDPAVLTVREWVKLCYGAVGAVPEFVSVPADVPQRSYFPFYAYQYTLDVSEMMKIFKEITPPENVLRGAYEWFSCHRDLIVRKPLHEFIETNFRGNV